MEPHLTELELAQYVDALASDRQDQLPHEILVHVVKCYECKLEIMEMWELIETIRPNRTIESPTKH